MLTDLFPMACLTIRDHLPRVATPVTGWALPRQLKIKKIPNRLAYRQVCGDIFSVKISSFRVCLGLCQVDRKQSAQPSPPFTECSFQSEVVLLLSQRLQVIPRRNLSVCMLAQ